MDNEVRVMIAGVAELPTTDETPGVARDELLDELIGLARKICDRETADDAAWAAHVKQVYERFGLDYADLDEMFRATRNPDLPR